MRGWRSTFSCSLAAWAVRAAASDLTPFMPPWDDGEPGPIDLRPILNQSAASIRPIRAENGRLVADGRRVRLFGVDVTAAACFPDTATADRLAPRLAKLGVNAVRFHFLDATWGDVRLIRYESGDWTNWDEAELGRLDHFMARLKEQGIYWDVNLLVGRRFGVGDGVDPSVNQLDWKAAHAVGFFHRPHLETQKAYARRLLDRVNPRTGLRVADDPALAVVEINNENGLMHTWLGGELDELPEPLAGDLGRQWTQWLVRRYGDTARLTAAWGARVEPDGAELLTNPSFQEGLRGWALEQHDGAAAEARASNGVAVVRVHRPGPNSWSVQFNQPGFAVRKDGLYTIRFRAAADRPRHIGANVIQAHEPWQGLGWEARLDLTPEWKEFTFTFVATADDARARFGFTDLGSAGAETRFAAVSVRPGGRLGLEAGDTLEGRGIRCPRVRGGILMTAESRRDWLTFLGETERAYWREMRAFLVNELGVRVPVVGTVVATSTPHLMAEFDLVDTHAYWRHPQWPGRRWDPENWFVRNQSMVDHPMEATVTRLAWQRVVGRPHMVSEYNHPAPNPHAAEGPLLLSAYAGLQDWDALFLYTWSHSDANTKAGRIPGYFDIGQHPTILSQVPAAALAFRRADVAPAREQLTAPWPVGTELDSIARRGRAWDAAGLNSAGLPFEEALRRRVGLDLAGASPEPTPPTPSEVAEWTADTGELVWQLPAPGHGIWTARAPRFKAAVGRLAGRDVDWGGGVALRVGDTRTGWAAVSMVLLEGDPAMMDPSRWLIAAASYTENTDMKWTSPSMESVGTNWGRPPALVEVVPATLRLPAARGWLRPLDERGRRIDGGVPLTGGEVRLGSPHRTLWYELEIEPAERR